MQESSYESLKRLGWISSFSRQVLLSRFVLRMCFEQMEFLNSPLKDGEKREAEEQLLAMLRLALSVEVTGGAKDYRLFAPYYPTDRSSEYSLKMKTDFGATYTLHTSESARPSVSLKTPLQHMELESGLVPAEYFADFVSELREVSRGITLVNKEIADERCESLFNRPLMESYAVSYYPAPEFRFWRQFLKRKLPNDSWSPAANDLSDTTEVRDKDRLTLLKSVADIPDHIWGLGPEAVDEAIKLIEAERLATILRETVIVNETEQLELVPQPLKEIRHLGHLLDVVKDTLEMATADLSNGLSKTCYQSQLINQTLNRYGNDPQRIEMDFERSKVSLLQEIAEDSIPVSAANRDLVQALSDAAGSIRDSNPDIAASRDRLNRIRLGDISAEDSAKIASVAIEVAEISEGNLREDLLEDRFRLPGVQRGAEVPDPLVPLGGAERNAAIEAQAAQIRMFSRLAKVWLFLRTHDRNIGHALGIVGSLASIIGLNLAVSV